LYESRRSLVWRAERLADGHPVVLKIHRQEYPSSAEVMLYQREYEILRTLEDPSIARALGLLKLHHRLVLVLEDIGGEPLIPPQQPRTFDVAGFLEVASRLCASVGVLHRGHVIHNDLSPGNILVTPGGERLQLIDLGSATALSSELTTFQNLETLEGTLAYMSPEQTGRTGRSVDQRSDLYSLGAVFYHMLAGRPPFSAPDATSLVFAHLAQEPEPLEPLVPGLPPVLAGIVRKLLSKNPEDRYQSVWGLQADLARCRVQLQAQGRVDDFSLAAQDLLDTLHLPSKLYGRARETARLLKLLERASRGGTELLAISGYSGIGKTALVQELYKPLTGHHGFFISGKFEQLRKNVPYAAVRTALMELIRQILTTDEDKLLQWRHKLEQALMGRGQVLLEVVPELERIVGPQAPVPALGASDSQARFAQVFQAFIRVFCAAEHPLVLFLDDLQWADHASLRLLELMLTDPELHHVLVITTYRDNEVNEAHPFLMSLRHLEKAGVSLHWMELPPLEREALEELLADTLQGAPESVRSLAELLWRKTEGNPFFVHQFLRMLHHEKLLSFDYGAHRWVWQLARIEAQSITDNVVELMVRRLQQLPGTAQEVLRLAACLGSRFDLDTLAVVSERSPSDTFRALMPALDAGYVLPVSSLEAVAEDSHPTSLVVRRCRFVHDRVQQAAHSLIPPSERAALHLRIGRLLLDNLPLLQQAERLFEIVGHLNQGSALIHEPGEVLALVRLNLEAGKRAEAATAYTAALAHLEAAAARSDEALWREHYEVALELSHQHAKAAYLTGDFEKAARIVHSAVAQARSAPDKAELYCLLLVQYTLRTKYAEAIQIGRHALGLLGITLPTDEEDLEAARDAAMASFSRALEDKPIASLAHLPLAEARDKQVAMRVLSALGPPCYRSHPQLWAVVVATTAHLYLQSGNAPQASYTYPAYGGLLASVRHDYAAAREFGEVALRLTEKFGDPSERSVCMLMVGSAVRHWSAPLRASTADYLRGYEAGVSSGNLQYAAYCLGHNLYCRFFQGASLMDWSHEIATARTFALEKKNQWTLDLADGCWLLARSLTGQSAAAGEHQASGLTEQEYLERLRQQNLQPLCIYYIMKARLMLLHGDVKAAAALCEEMEPLLVRVATQGLLPWAEHIFTRCLVYTALHGQAGADEQARMQSGLEEGQRLLRQWATHSPANFLHKELLVQAEVARLHGDTSEALSCYVRSLEAARKEDFTQHAALAAELAARFLLQQGREKLGLGYLHEARHTYERWGAVHKVGQLTQQLSQLETFGPSATVGGADPLLVGTTAAQLDALAVLKASQALSGQMVMSRLLDTLMGFVLEHTGAERGSLSLVYPDGLALAAEASVEQHRIHVRVGPEQKLSESSLPLSLLNYVRRTGEKVILADASRPNPFSADPYLQHKRPKSVLCFPIHKQAELIGLLYLENNLTARAFTPHRLAVLEVLASQSAISIENARLYAEVQRAEAALRTANDELEQRVEERTRKLKEAQSQLVDAARSAGMAEIASNVLHNVGNVLTSAIVTLDHARAAVDASRVGRVKQLSAMLEEHSGDLADFLTRDARGQKLPAYFTALGDVLLQEQAELQKQLKAMTWHIDHIRSIVQVQQTYAKATLLVDDCDLSLLVEDALRVQLATLHRHGISVRSELAPQCRARVDRHKVLQILLNLISNARYALEEVPQERRHLLVRLSTDGKMALIQVVDTGVGIAPEAHEKLFSHGYTTRKDGHGFGLHSSALAAALLGGTLTLRSEGLGKGATATLELPLDAPLSEELARPAPVGPYSTR
jgi:predicted ATPase/GAF domain-containing protein